MPLQSDLFKDDEKLNAILVNPNAHLIDKTPRIRGDHVAKVQEALKRLQPTASISQTEIDGEEYGSSTADAVLAYKKQRKIINTGYQSAPDKIVGTMTIQRMDDELSGTPSSRTGAMDRAFADSRASLRNALNRLRNLRNAIDDLMRVPDADIARASQMVQVQVAFAREIAVLSRRLVLPPDVTSPAFAQALAKVIDLMEKNLAQPKSLFDAGRTGVCSASFPPNVAIGGIPFARTGAGLANGKTHLCEPFFQARRDLERDVITHEIFHLFGLGDHSVNSTSDGLTNANTIAQIVARVSDRFRNINSDGGEPDNPPLPSSP